MKKHTISSPGLIKVKIPRCRTFTPLKFSESCQSRKDPPKKNDLIEKIYIQKKRYSILNVPKLQSSEFTEEAEKSEEPVKNLENPEEKIEKTEKNLEKTSKDQQAKLPLAKLKKIRRSYRPTFLHNQENLKAELEKFKDSEGNKKPRVVFNENFKKAVKSDIEEIMESQDYFRSFRGSKNVKISSEYFNTDRADNNLDRRKHSIATSNNRDYDINSPQCSSKKFLSNEGNTDRRIFSSGNYLQRTPLPSTNSNCLLKSPLPCTKAETNQEIFKAHPSKSYSVALSQQLVKRIKTHKFNKL